MSRRATGKGMCLPFQPLNLAFRHMYYSVDMPSVSPVPLSCALLSPHSRSQHVDICAPFLLFTLAIQHMHSTVWRS